MELYEDESQFVAAVIAASNSLRERRDIVEKDYFVTLLLRKLTERIPGLLFKGGTCLSKCFHVIQRFSEDIDLTLDVGHFTWGNKRKANKAVIEVCDELGFDILNREKVEKHSHGAYNAYMVSYPHHFDSMGLSPIIKVEMVFIQKAYPDVSKELAPMIYEALTDETNKTQMTSFGLSPFSINAQSLERTFVDKIFALCDYYLRNEKLRQSRHIYDIFQMMNVISWKSLSQLVREVRQDRIPNKTCLSAQPNMDVPWILKEIVRTGFFKDDYNTVTLSLLHQKVSYEEAIAALNDIAETDVFRNKDSQEETKPK